MPTTETFRVTIWWTAQDSEDMYTWMTNITITDDQPFADVADEAAEKFYECHESSDEIHDTAERSIG
jgi:hypothetical protein